MVVAMEARSGAHHLLTGARSAAAIYRGPIRNAFLQEPGDQE
jgi:hypothetical protein